MLCIYKFGSTIIFAAEKFAQFSFSGQMLNLGQNFVYKQGALHVLPIPVFLNF
jgi:hypothetical protein